MSDARNLIWLTFGKFYLSISISASSRYHRETLAAILVALPEVTSSKTITMGSTNKAKLTEAEIAVATAKGWTVA